MMRGAQPSDVKWLQVVIVMGVNVFHGPADLAGFRV